MQIILNNIFSAEFIYAWIRIVTPILLPALGAAICNQAGVVNLGLEGIMLLSALGGVLGSAYGGSLLAGALAGLATALVVSLFFAWFHLNMEANAVLCGTAVNIFATGATVLLLFTLTGEKGASSSIKSAAFPTVRLSLIERIPVLGEILSGHNLITWLAFLAVLLVWILFYRMPLGLRIRAVGENPMAAASVGISVRRVRYTAILLCGVLSGLGGMYMSMGYLNVFTRDMVAGRGFIALASAAMGQFTPFGVVLSSMLFALFDALSNTMQLAAIPSQFVQMLPYAATILGLTIFSIQKKRQEKRRLLALGDSL